MKNITDSQLAQILNNFDSSLGITEYAVTKSRISQEDKNELAKQLKKASICKSANAIEYDEVRQLAKEVVKLSAKQPALWPSLDCDI